MVEDVNPKKQTVILFVTLFGRQKIGLRGSIDQAPVGVVGVVEAEWARLDLLCNFLLVDLRNESRLLRTEVDLVALAPQHPPSSAPGL